MAKFETIVYVSCNPDTLVRDINILAETHTIRHLAVFDQFPYTHHLECGVVLVRKSGKEEPEAREEEAKEGEDGRETKRQRTD